jgi:integrase
VLHIPPVWPTEPLGIIADWRNDLVHRNGVDEHDVPRVISAPQLQSALQKVSDLIEAADHSLRLEVDYFGNSRTEENRKSLRQHCAYPRAENHPDDRTRNPGGYSATGTQLPVSIDYPAALALRQMALVQDELPKYLLAPEVSALLHYVPDLHRKMLLATLWNTGARINEALALTRSDFSWHRPTRSCSWPHSNRAEKAARTAGRAPVGSQTHRLVPLSDANYVGQLEMMVATLKIPLERRNKRSGRTEKARIWEITDRTVRTWLSEAVEAAAADGVTFSVPVTPHTFRHSYAMHMLYAGIPLKVLQSLMGHKSISSTEVYTKVFALDVAARHRVQFQMPGDEAVALLKNR